jgi:prenylcysteine oxidase / farnesylcysteine lyase
LKDNYGQNLDQIHALGALISLVGSGPTFSVIGGNWQIFDKMISSSGAKLQLNTEVDKIEKVGLSQWKVSWNNTSDTFDGVVLAAPFVNSISTELTVAIH